MFADPQLTTLGQPHSAAVADLDGDGTPDVAVGHLTQPMVSIFRGTGGGRFAARTDVFSSSAVALAVLDTDEDGDLDLALTDTWNDRIVLVQNQGNGTFLSGASLGVGDFPGALIAVDLGLDGRPELLSADSGSDRISVLVNLVGGAFSSAIPFAVAGGPSSLAALDQDHDGRADVAVTCFGGEKLQFLRNLGNTFAAPLELPSFPAPSAVIAADLDGDTFAELATLSNETLPFTGNVLSVYPNQHAAGFGAAVHTFTPPRNNDLVPLDHDGDGTLDLAVATSGDPANPGFEGAHPSVVVYANDGSGALAFSLRRTVSTSPSTVEAGDLDGNGQSDLVVVNTDAATLSVLLDGGNDLAGPPRSSTPYASRSLDSADLDGDGDRDLAVAKSFVGGAEAAVLLNQGQGLFGPYTSYPMAAWEIECADVDGDDAVDLVVG
ncbi:MAG TPA: FG-GAP-like repeat-containing protein, partial [Planctomycetota bacterium]